MQDTRSTTKNNPQPDAIAMGRPKKAAEPAADSEPEELPGMLDKLSDKILLSINARFDTFEKKFETVVTAQQVLTTRVDTLEGQSLDHETRIQLLEKLIAELQRENAKLRAKAIDADNRSRRNNIKIVGIPEGEERGRPTEFVTNLIPKLFGGQHFPQPVIIDRAHRIPLPRPAQGAKPRTIIARVHFYQEKETILRLGRQQQQPLQYEGHRMFIFPDYTADVMAERRGFREITQALRKLDVKYSLRFPARLCVGQDDQQKMFNTPEEAMPFLAELKRR